jgi:hypothetical protein
MDWMKKKPRASGVERASDANSYAKLEWAGPNQNQEVRNFASLLLGIDMKVY